MKLNKLLARQIHKYVDAETVLPEWFHKFVNSVNESYSHYENDRILLERAMDISSGELDTLLEKNRAEAKKNKDTLYELKEMLFSLDHNNSNEKEDDISTLTTLLKNQLEIQNKTRKSLLENETNLTSLVENTNDLILSIDINYNIISFNSHFVERIVFLSELQPKKGMNILKILPRKQSEEWKKLFDAAFDKKQFTKEVELFVESKKQIYEMSFNPIVSNEKVIGATLFSKNITDKYKQQQIIKNSLLEKEILLKEIHHRVKNNMQVITSLLSLQSKKIEDENVKKIFQSSEYRIMSMALIHEMLYQSDDFRKIDYKKYLVNLIDTLVLSVKGNQHQIEVNYEVDDLYLDMDTAIPLGLLINEIITNALKHGIAKKGNITVLLKKIDELKYLLEIGDNGIGMSENITLENSPSLGLELMHYLTEQIEGELKRDLTKKGTHYYIKFNES